MPQRFDGGQYYIILTPLLMFEPFMGFPPRLAAPVSTHTIASLFGEFSRQFDRFAATGGCRGDMMMTIGCGRAILARTY
jgi:hypothetical protein